MLHIASEIVCGDGEPLAQSEKIFGAITQPG
jgi:hypothetical protein